MASTSDGGQLPSPALRTEATPETLHLALDSHIMRETREGPVKGNQDGQELGAHDQQGEAKETGLYYSSREGKGSQMAVRRYLNCSHKNIRAKNLFAGGR